MADENERDENEEREDENESGATSEKELGDGGRKALAAERKARRDAEKAAKALQVKLQEIEDADKSEVEKLRGQVEGLTKQAEAAQAKADRFEVAAAKGLSLAQARRLVGSTKEELEDDADAMRAELGLDKDDSDESDDKNEEKDEAVGRPRERMRSGASNEEDEAPDAGKLADSILS